MQVTVLVVIFQGSERVTLHEDGEEALRELIRFTEEHWSERFAAAPQSPSYSEEQRIALFFDSDDANYYIGEADMTSLAKRIEEQLITR